MKKFDRNKCLALGTLILLLGLQFRVVERVVLTQEVTNAAAKIRPAKSEAAPSALQRLLPSMGPTVGRASFEPPSWIGLALISVGAVLTLQSFVMPNVEE
ncbi:MAG: hypothetical protein N2C14_01060 [Planctomycetales bacterium]